MLLSVPYPRETLPQRTELPKAQNLNYMFQAVTKPNANILLVTKATSLIEEVRQALAGKATIQIVSNLPAAIDFLSDTLPDLILSECDPDLKSFIESLLQEKELEIPLLVLASLQERKRNLSLLKSGVTDFILRPVEAEELQVRVRSYLEYSRAKRLLESETGQTRGGLEELAQDLIVKARELQRLNRMKDEFMAVLSHELRNPINVIAGFAEILKTEADTSELTKEAAEAIYRNAQFQIKLVTDLLDVSRGVAGKLVLDCKPMEMNRLLKELWPSALEAAEKKGLHLSFQEEEHSGWIHGDAIRISQVIWNLLSNAIKFTPEGGRIEARLSRSHQWIEFSVTDTGVGIDPSFLPYMFERFHQQDSSITKTFGGLGLGLAIVRHIVELHAGTVTASSEGPGHGATFTVRLPALPN